MGESNAEARLARILDAQSVLARVAATLGPDLDIDEVLTSVLTAMRKIVDFKGGTVQLVDERGVYIAASDPPVTTEMAALRVRLGEGISGRVVTTGQPVWSGDIKEDKRVSAAMRGAGSNLETRSYLAVPLVCLGETIGALQIDSKEVDAFDDDDVTLLEGLAAQVAGVIESARRYALVMELERLKSDFISRVSHELRTPITIIDGFVMTMLDHGERLDDEARRDMLARCRTASAPLGAAHRGAHHAGPTRDRRHPVATGADEDEEAAERRGARRDRSVVGARRGSRRPHPHHRSRADATRARVPRRQRRQVRPRSDRRHHRRRRHRGARPRSGHRRRCEGVVVRAVHPGARHHRHPRSGAGTADGAHARGCDGWRNDDCRPR